MASTNDMMVFPDLGSWRCFPGGCWFQERQADCAAKVNIALTSSASLPRPACRERSDCEAIRVRGSLRTHCLSNLRRQPLTPTLSPQGRGEGANHTDAVVTPPSTTMVWPVMKVEASEAR